MNHHLTRSLIAMSLVALAGTTSPAFASGADDLPAGITLPSDSQMVGFQAAANRTASTFGNSVVTRVKIEFEDGRFVYKVEAGASRSRDRIRQDINVFNGIVVRSRVQTLSTNDARAISNLSAALPAFTVDFGEAAAIGVTSRGAGQAVDVRIEPDGRTTYLYKVVVLNNATKAEVRINPITGQVVSTSVDDNGGGNSGGNGNGNGNSGGNGGGNSGGNSGGGNAGGGNSGGGNSGSGNNGGSNVPLGDNATRLNLAINTALASQPAGSIALEAELFRHSRAPKFEVKTVAPGATTAIEFRFNLLSAAIVRTEIETMDASDAANAAAVFAAVGNATPIGYQAAMQNALAVRSGDVTKIEMKTVGSTAIYEVKIFSGNRERSVKVNALTGAIIP